MRRIGRRRERIGSGADRCRRRPALLHNFVEAHPLHAPAALLRRAGPASTIAHGLCTLSTAAPASLSHFQPRGACRDARCAMPSASRATICDARLAGSQMRVSCHPRRRSGTLCAAAPCLPMNCATPTRLRPRTVACRRPCRTCASGRHGPGAARYLAAAARDVDDTRRASPMDQCVDRPRCVADRRAGCSVLPVRYQIHACRRCRRRGVDPQTLDDPCGRTRSSAVLADSPIDHRRRDCHRVRHARRTQPAGRQAQVTPGEAAGERGPRAPVSADVKRVETATSRLAAEERANCRQPRGYFAFARRANSFV